MSLEFHSSEVAKNVDNIGFNYDFSMPSEDIAKKVMLKDDFYGMIAERDIRTGETIVNSLPMTWIEFKEDKAIIGVWTTNIQEKMRNAMSLKDDDESKKYVAWFQQLLTLSPRKLTLEITKMMEICVNKGQDTVYPFIYAKLEANAFKMGNHVKTLYMASSFFNHSCLPNVIQIFDYSSKAIYLKAFRDIKKGEELCISYIDNHILFPEIDRQTILADKGIKECYCSSCINGELDLLAGFKKLCFTYATSFETGRCHFCQQQTKPCKVCSKCKKAAYCGTECQRLDWCIHKMICHKLN